MTIFISHIAEEAALAQVLKDHIESTFPGQCEVFVSSDRDDIPPGSKWLEEIDGALEAAKLVLVLASPESLTRPWINFEAGCAWMKRVPVIPVCHSGQEKGALPVPYSNFHALDAEEEDFLKDLFQSIARYLEIPGIPRVSYPDMKKELDDALATIPVRSITQQRFGTIHNDTGQLEEDTLEILKAVADARPGGCDVEELAKQLTMHREKVQYYLDQLLKSKHLYAEYGEYGVAFVVLAPRGRAYLVERGLL